MNKRNKSLKVIAKIILIKLFHRLIRSVKIIFARRSLYQFSIFEDWFLESVILQINDTMVDREVPRSFRSMCRGIFKLMPDFLIEIIALWVIKGLVPAKRVRLVRFMLLAGLNPALPVATYDASYNMDPTHAPDSLHKSGKKTMTLSHAILVYALRSGWDDLDIMHLNHMGLIGIGIPGEIPPYWDLFVFGRHELAVSMYGKVLGREFCPIVARSVVPGAGHPYLSLDMSHTLEQYVRSKHTQGLGVKNDTDPYKLIELLKGSNALGEDALQAKIDSMKAKGINISIHAYLTEAILLKYQEEETFYLIWKFSNPLKGFSFDDFSHHEYQWELDNIFKHQQSLPFWEP